MLRALLLLRVVLANGSDDDTILDVGEGVDIEQPQPQSGGVQFDHSSSTVGYFLKKHHSFVFLQDPTSHKLTSAQKSEIKQLKKAHKAIKKKHQVRSQSVATLQDLLDESSRSLETKAAASTPNVRGILKSSSTLNEGDQPEPLDESEKAFFDELRERSSLKAAIRDYQQRFKKLTRTERGELVVMEHEYQYLVDKHERQMMQSKLPKSR